MVALGANEADNIRLSATAMLQKSGNIWRNFYESDRLFKFGI